MTDSIASRIVAALVARSEQITPENGYETSAGERVFVSRPMVDPETDLPCIVIDPIDAIPDGISGQRIKWRRRIAIDALGVSDPDNPGLVAEALSADLQKAILLPADAAPGGKPLGGLARKLIVQLMETSARNDGGTVAGATLELAVEYVSGYGDPYN